jgi:dienelactone hydrolase
MARDSGPRLLLGRPCYFATATTSACEPLLWTHRRYAPEVIDSMVSALRAFLAAHPFDRVLLIGYSGGGTIAWLMAPSVREAAGVLTVAANLDVAAWAAAHDYTPLAGSLDPARSAALPTRIVQLNVTGGRDRVVPPAVNAAFSRSHPEAREVRMPDFDHVCCWIESWPQVLATFEDTISRQPR